jgi:hypothetical protein
MKPDNNINSQTKMKTLNALYVPVLLFSLLIMPETSPGQIYLSDSHCSSFAPTVVKPMAVGQSYGGQACGLSVSG